MDPESARPRPSTLALVATLAMLAFSWPGPASADPPSWGLRAGWSWARLEGDGGQVIAPDFRSDFTLGGFVAKRIGPKLWFQPELTWTTKGGQDDFQVPSYPSPTEVTLTDFHVEHRLSYLELPLLLRLELPALGPIEPYTLAGPEPAWLVGDDHPDVAITGSTTVPARAARASATIYEELGTLGSPLPARTFDLGLVGGLGFWVGRKPIRYGLEARYTYGMLDMVPGGDFEFHNAVLGVTAAVEIR